MQFADPLLRHGGRRREITRRRWRDAVNFDGDIDGPGKALHVPSMTTLRGKD